MINAPNPTSPNEAHISSLVVQAKPVSLPALTRRIGAIAGAEIAITSPDGKLVICLETTTLGEVTDSIDMITKLPDVLSCTLVSHHVEDPAGLDEPVDMSAPEKAETTA